MHMPAIELLVRVGLATVLGIAIGIERQWRSRMAGLQTMALVSMGSALYLVLGAYAFGRESDPARVAAQIVTGVGFLGAGVIMKQGLSVTGLNTAATLWATAAVGALAGAWMWKEALAGAAIIVAGNGFLYPLAVRMDRLHLTTGRETPPADYLVEVACAADAETGLRPLIVQTLTRSGFHLTSLRSIDAGVSNEREVRAELSAARRDDTVMDGAVGALSAEPAVRSVRWAIRGEAGVDWSGRSND